MKKMTYSEMRDAVCAVTELSNGYNNRAHYTLGAFSVLIADIVADLPKHKQAEVIRSLESLSTRLATIE